MSRTPEFKVYDADGVYQAATRDTTLAAAVVSILGEGATVRLGHRRIIWTEGEDELWAAESYDVAANSMIGRMSA